MNSNRQITSDEDVRKLIHSGQWSQHRKSVVRRVAYVGIAVVAIPLSVVGLLRTSGVAPVASVPEVAQANMPEPIQHADVRSLPIVSGSESHHSCKSERVSKNEVVSLSQDSVKPEVEALQETVHPQQEYAMAETKPTVEHRDFLAEIQETDYTMIVWNDYSEADTIVSRLNHFLIKKGV